MDDITIELILLGCLALLFIEDYIIYKLAYKSGYNTALLNLK